MSEQQTMVAAQYVLEVRLADGDRLTLDAGNDPESAQAELAAVHAALEAGAFVQLGDSAIVRAAEIRSARIHRVGGMDGNGFSEALRPQRIGGYGMSTYDTERRDVAASHAPMRSGEQHRADGGPGFLDNYVGYGRKPYAETKPFWMTSEFLAAAAAIAAFAIALGTNDLVDGFRGWLLIAIVASAYILSRGIAKAGARDPNPDRRYAGGGGGY
jgi:hypothetical protein